MKLKEIVNPIDMCNYLLRKYSKARIGQIMSLDLGDKVTNSITAKYLDEIVRISKKINSLESSDAN